MLLKQMFSVAGLLMFVLGVVLAGSVTSLFGKLRTQVGG